MQLSCSKSTEAASSKDSDRWSAQYANSPAESAALSRETDCVGPLLVRWLSCFARPSESAIVPLESLSGGRRLGLGASSNQ